MFTDAQHFETWANNMFRYSDSVKSVYILAECTDFWDRSLDGYQDSLRHVQGEMSAVFRVAASLKVQRDELDAFAFYMAGAIAHTRSGPNWGSVPNFRSVSPDKVWDRMKDPEAFAYCLRVLRHFVASGNEVVDYLCTSFERGTPTGYITALATQDGTAQFRIAYAESQVKYLSTRVPADYARALRTGHRSSMSAETIAHMYRRGIPIEYAAGCLAHQVDPDRIVEAWKAGVPVEYAIAL